MDQQLTSIRALDGINSYASPNLSKAGEFRHMENATCDQAGTVKTAKGSTQLGDDGTSHFAGGIFRFPNEYTSSISGSPSGNCGLYRVVGDGNGTIQYLDFDYTTWVPLAGHGTNIGYELEYSLLSSCIADGCLYVAGGDVPIRYVMPDGTTTYVAPGGNLNGAPEGRKIAYYKGRLYIGDYWLEIDGTPRWFHDHVRFSSTLLGIVSLVEGDFAAGATTLNVSDTKYILATDTLEVWRGSTLIETLTVTGKSEATGTYTITVSATTADILSSDELWVSGTHDLDADRVFRWADAGIGNEEMKRYDDFVLPGVEGANSINTLCVVGDYLAIASRDSFAWWDTYRLTGSGLGIGVCSPNGFVSAFGSGYGLDYTGVYQWTPGSASPKVISTPVEAYITGAKKTDIERASSVRSGFHLMWHLGEVTLYKADGSVDKVIENCTIDYDIRLDNWYVHTDKAMDFMCNWSEGERANAIAYLQHERQVPYVVKAFEAFYGDKEDDGSSSEEEVFFRADTVPIQLSSTPDTIAYPSAVVIECDRGSGGQVFARLDEGEWYQLKGEFNKGVSVIPVTSPNPDELTPPKCRRISFSLRHSMPNGTRVTSLSVRFAQSLEDADGLQIESNITQ
ncbi:MAG: hypothetical protein WC455_10085 [Dehalococcoidia bacterium]|jgi:hypothetical protein